jgi:putative ABC transport system substrate-binding protein
MRYGTVGGIFALVASILATPLSAHAQQQKLHRIGWLITVPSSSAPTLQAVAAFRQALGDLGHVEGQNLIVEYRFAEGDPKQLPALATELASLKVDIIVTDTSDATRAAQQATTTIPIVMVVSAAPVEQGFVASLARPGGNITGLSMLLPELARKRLELLKYLVPKATSVAVLGAPANPNSILQWRDTEAAGRLLGLKLQRLEVQGPNPDFERAFDAASRGRADALIVLPNALFARDRVQIVALANKRRLPAMYFERMFAEAGGLMSYGPSIPDMFRRAASYVAKILKGANPGDLPVEQPTKFELVLNLKTAEALGITFPPTLRSLADDVIR